MVLTPEETDRHQQLRSNLSQQTQPDSKNFRHLIFPALAFSFSFRQYLFLLYITYDELQDRLQYGF